ncbi:MAG: hypothetical protein F6K08_28795 [Okeania sp. SIO1H6]|uniref:Uncharacterized protein n=1 Tax=Okeania hirsuta TaxID=1458930 RepID=A0A3N6N179_9CYAN|nr:hypothetical protein [Okeania sp. SIO1H6]RQH08165.1 hypothetical protein D4Z78_29255 [Okeania hirsuta]RQH29736.1 hypothetical protein D5R40_24450 [Okeania hirsuta]
MTFQWLKTVPEHKGDVLSINFSILTFQWLKTVPEHKRDVLPKFFGPDCSANRCLIRACQITLKVFTDIGFSIFGLKKVPAFQWQELQKASILGWLWQKN